MILLDTNFNNKLIVNYIKSKLPLMIQIMYRIIQNN